MQINTADTHGGYQTALNGSPLSLASEAQMTRNGTLIVVAAAALVASLPLIVSAQPGDPHHPSSQAAAQTVPAQIPGRAMGAMSMMGGGMMGGPGMMGSMMGGPG